MQGAIMRVVCTVTLIVLLTASAGRAMVVLPADLGTLSRQAGAIVRGRVSAVEFRWTDDRRRVETLVTLEVESQLKGGTGESVTFVVPGGRLGRYRSVMVGAPEFERDQRVIVFLGHTGPSLPFVLGLGQGVYRVVRSGTGWVVTPPALIATATPTRVVRGDPARRPLEIAAFEQQVRALAGAIQ
jgi:hypothetical protein